MPASQLTIGQWTSADLSPFRSPASLWQDFLSEEDMGENSNGQTMPQTAHVFTDPVSSTTSPGLQSHQLCPQPPVCSAQNHWLPSQCDPSIWISPVSRSDSSSTGSDSSPLDTISLPSFTPISLSNSHSAGHHPQHSSIPEAENSLLALASLSKKHPLSLNCKLIEDSQFLNSDQPAVSADCSSRAELVLPSIRGADGGAEDGMITMSTQQQEMDAVRHCVVCGETANGRFFGARVCLPCKSFFIRCTKAGQPAFSADCGGQCGVHKSGRIRCQFCRFQKCLSVGMFRKEKPEAVSPGDGQVLCQVCNDIANGIHFGVNTCEGCKKFFRRGLKEHESYACKASGKCIINPRMRNNCRYCRYRKCVQVGMSRHAIKMGRPKKRKRVFPRYFDDLVDGQPSSSRTDSNRSTDDQGPPSCVEAKQDCEEDIAVDTLGHKFTLDAVYDASYLSDEFLEAVNVTSVDEESSTPDNSRPRRGDDVKPVSAQESDFTRSASFNELVTSSETGSRGNIGGVSSQSLSSFSDDASLPLPSPFAESAAQTASAGAAPIVDRHTHTLPLPLPHVPYPLTSAAPPQPPRHFEGEIPEGGLQETVATSCVSFPQCDCYLLPADQKHHNLPAAAYQCSSTRRHADVYPSPSQTSFHSADHRSRGLHHPSRPMSGIITGLTDRERDTRGWPNCVPPTVHSSVKQSASSLSCSNEDRDLPVQSTGLVPTPEPHYSSALKANLLPEVTNDKTSRISVTFETTQDSEGKELKTFSDEIYEFFESLHDKCTISTPKGESGMNNVAPITFFARKENTEVSKLVTPSVKLQQGTSASCKATGGALEKENRRRPSECALDSLSFEKRQRLLGHPRHNREYGDCVVDKALDVSPAPSPPEPLSFPLIGLTQTEQVHRPKQDCAVLHSDQSLCRAQVLSKSPVPTIFCCDSCNPCTFSGDSLPAPGFPLNSSCNSLGCVSSQNFQRMQREPVPQCQNNFPSSIRTKIDSVFSTNLTSQEEDIVPLHTLSLQGAGKLENTNRHVGHTCNYERGNCFAVNGNIDSMSRADSIDNIANALCSLASAISQSTELLCRTAASYSRLDLERSDKLMVTNGVVRGTESPHSMPVRENGRDTGLHAVLTSILDSQIDSGVNGSMCIFHAQKPSVCEPNEIVSDSAQNVLFVKAKEDSEENIEVPSPKMRHEDVICDCSVGQKALLQHSPAKCFISIDLNILTNINQHFLSLDNSCEGNGCAVKVMGEQDWRNTPSMPVPCQECRNRQVTDQSSSSSPHCEVGGLCTRLCHSYWHDYCPSLSVVCMTARNKQLLATVESAFIVFQDHLSQLHCRHNQHLAIKQNATHRLLEQLHQQGVAICSIAKHFMLQIPGSHAISAHDISVLGRQFGFGAALIMQSSQNYDSDSQQFRQLWMSTTSSCSPLVSFMEHLLDTGRAVYDLAMDRMETALLCALSLFSTDVSVLKDKNTVSQVRASLLDVMEAYISLRHQWPTARVKRLFSILPAVRLLSAWHSVINRHLQ